MDATLWFANAIYQTLKAEWEETFARRMLVLLEASVDWHVRGTLYGIVMDPEDGLLQQGEKGVQLTWMDAKIDDWVVATASRSRSPPSGSTCCTSSAGSASVWAKP